MPHEELPQGFLWMQVPVTVAEYNKLRNGDKRWNLWPAPFTASGCVWENFRIKAGLPGRPHGLRAALERRKKNAKTT